MIYTYICVWLSESRKNQSASADVKRRDEVLRILTGDWDTLPQEAPTGVRVYLAANSAGITSHQHFSSALMFDILFQIT